MARLLRSVFIAVIMNVRRFRWAREHNGASRVKIFVLFGRKLSSDWSTKVSSSELQRYREFKLPDEKIVHSVLKVHGKLTKIQSHGNLLGKSKLYVIFKKDRLMENAIDNLQLNVSVLTEIF